VKGKRLSAQHLKARQTVAPPRPGPVGLLAAYGPRLLFVRYRHDAAKKRRYKTVEIIVDEEVRRLSLLPIPATPGNFCYAFRQAAKHAGVGFLGPHVLRHTFGSRLAMAGVDLRTVQELMGRKDIKMAL
jgi:hypothetical protein